VIHDDELWILSFYRRSEISGALFFGRLAQTIRAGPIQHDLTKHFSDESMHAWYWTDCIEKLGAKPIQVDRSYQDQYLEAAGLPVNIMEILAITQVFERRVIGQYALHRALPGLPAEVEATLNRIMQDEKWHIEWVRDALVSLEPEYGAEHIARTIERYAAADRHVYERTLDEHSGRLKDLIARSRRRGPR
jgi:rubrerythrin